ncbi:MAG: acetylxylan esterase [Candidatus Competibacteraceae bacterium]
MASPVPAQRLFRVEYTSLGHFRIKGWLTVPRDEPIARGAVIGHGYGGRDGPDREVPINRCAVLFPCARGLSLSAHPAIPDDPARHVLYGIQNRHAYILGGCAADIWCGATALLEVFPAAATRLDYLGISFGGGVGALALPWDERFHSAHLCVPSFGNHPVRLNCPCVGSGEAVRTYQQERGGMVLEVLRYFDAASAARHLRIPMHIAVARFDPAVPPPGQFSIYNAIDSPKRLFVLSAGHFDYSEQAVEQQRLFTELQDFFKAA